MVDNSPVQSERTASTAALETARRSPTLDVEYLGLSELHGRAAEWAERSGVDTRTVEFAVLDPLGIGYSPGASRNAIALSCHGHAYASIDDDMGLTCQPAPDPESGTTSVQGDPTEFWFDPPVGAFEDDVLRHHEAVLGQPGPDRASGIVRATWVGFSGDAATTSPLLPVALDGPSRERLLRDEATFERFLATRCLVRGVRRTSLGRGMVWTTGATAYDGSVLPPFLPVGRGEGLVFAALFHATQSGTLAFLPWIVPHETRPPPAAGAEDGGSPPYPLALFLCRLIMKSGGHGLRQIGAHLESLGRQSAHAVAALVADCREACFSARVQLLEQRLERYGETPRWWSHAARQYQRALLRALAPSVRAGIGDLETAVGADEARAVLPELLLRYGRLLQSWTRLAEATRSSATATGLAEPGR
ncbi:MAG: hypothetical protein AAF721_00070 [Myxococcota bacterium]